MHDSTPSPGLEAPGDASTSLDEMRLQHVPQGAFALAGAAVGLLVAAWLAVYLLVFLARGPVG